MRAAEMSFFGGKMNFRWIILLMPGALLVACTSLERSADSGYNNSPRSSLQRTRTTRTSGDEITLKPAKINISEKMQLKQLENSLSTRKEMEQYSKALPWFKDEEERIEFLSLKGFENRQEWLDSKNFADRSEALQSTFKDLVEAQDIAIGMPQNLVRKSWGEPDNIDVSGHPSLKNERWKYARFISSPDGYKPEKKIVYFEGGRVIGWEVE
jgi:hypothetical protein